MVRNLRNFFEAMKGDFIIFYNHIQTTPSKENILTKNMWRIMYEFSTSSIGTRFRIIRTVAPPSIALAQCLQIMHEVDPKYK